MGQDGTETRIDGVYDAVGCLAEWDDILNGVNNARRVYKLVRICQTLSGRLRS